MTVYIGFHCHYYLCAQYYHRNTLQVKNTAGFYAALLKRFNCFTVFLVLGIGSLP
jgi:hypothetical protein